jgi:hypothetical protein
MINNNNNNNVQEKVLFSNVYLFVRNIKTLIRLRSKVEMDFLDKDENGKIRYQHNGDLSNYSGMAAFNLADDLIAINTAIIMNCFGLFEACYEQLLLSFIKTSKLDSIQERIISKYIDFILKLSSEQNFSKEYFAITNKKIKEILNDEERNYYEGIKIYYIIRNLIAHGSAIRKEFSKGTIDSKLNLDPDELEYQKFLEFIKNKLKIPMPNESLDLELVLQINAVASYLGIAVYKIMQKFLIGTTALKFLQNEGTEELLKGDIEPPPSGRE